MGITACTHLWCHYNATESCEFEDSFWQRWTLSSWRLLFHMVGECVPNRCGRPAWKAFYCKWQLSRPENYQLRAPFIELGLMERILGNHINMLKQHVHWVIGGIGSCFSEEHVANIDYTQYKMCVTTMHITPFTLVRHYAISNPPKHWRNGVFFLYTCSMKTGFGVKGYAPHVLCKSRDQNPTDKDRLLLNHQRWPPFPVWG